MNTQYPYHGKRNEEPPIPEELPKIDITQLPISTEETKWEPVELTERDIKQFKLHIPKPLTPYDADQIKTFLQSILTGLNETDYKNETDDHYHYALLCLAVAFATTDKIKLQKITNYPHKQITQTITNLCKNNLIKRKHNPIHQLLTSDNGAMALTLLALVAAGEITAKKHKGQWLWKKPQIPQISSQETPPTTRYKGKQQGGKTRMSNLTPQQRSELASKAAKTRWEKQRKQMGYKTPRISSQETSTPTSPTTPKPHPTQNG